MKSRSVPFIFVLVLTIAAVLRLYGLNWDEGQHAHPDERWIAMVAPTIAWPQQRADILDPRRSTLNPLWVPDHSVPGSASGGEPRNFAYGHLPLYLHALVGHTWASLGQWLGASALADREPCAEIARVWVLYGEYGGINVVGRVLSVLFDLGTICLVYLLGVRVYDRWVGRMAAASIASSVMHIQLSHFSTFDVITTFFVTLSIYGAVCVLDAWREAARTDAGLRSPARFVPAWSGIFIRRIPIRRILIRTVWAGAAAGLAVASKFSALPLLGVLVIAQLIGAARHAGTRRPGVLLRLGGPYVVLSLLSALLAFALTSPFALLDWRLYLRQIIEQGRMVRGVADWPFTRQYIGTTPLLYPIVQQVRWGLGWPLGIVAFAGFGWAIVRQFLRIRTEDRLRTEDRSGMFPGSLDKELVMLIWAAPYFVLTGTFMVKFMRYMLPVLPVFVLMGMAMMRGIRNWGAGPSRSRLASAGKRAIKLAPYLVLAMTILYALAFTRVYAQTHPWIQASRWIYRNVPDGAVIAVEHWDDHLPLSLPEKQAGRPAILGERGYRHVELPMYEPDEYGKFDLIRSRLREADTIVLATNRLHRTIPRLPERYPASAEFYRRLFAEELGFARVADFTAYPGLFVVWGGEPAGWQMVDDDADESFTVYDHPRPIVFRKVRDLDDGEWNAFFDAPLAQTPIQDSLPRSRWSSLLADLGLHAASLPWSSAGGDPPSGRPHGDVLGEEETARTLLLDRPVGELPVVDDFGWNRWASKSTPGSTALAVFLWWLLITALGWLAWPVTFVLFGGLRDRGVLLSRMVALLIVGYLIWLPSSLKVLKNGLPLTYAAIGVLALLAALLLWRYQAEMRTWLQQRWRLVLVSEVLFAASFLVFVGIRILNPDLWQPWNGGEKLMDIAYLNSVLRSAYFPPPDPYYAQGYLNYYYYGQFLLSILIRLTGIKSTIGFNLAVPLLFAFTVSTAFSIGYTLAAGEVLPVWRRRNRRGGPAEECPADKHSAMHGLGHGLLAALCVAILGNLASATQIAATLRRVGGSTFTSRVPGLESLVHTLSGVSQILFHGARFPGFNYWDPSRVVGFTINEFPYWSFLFADLHPHMINIPFTLLILALALNWLRILVRRRQPLSTCSRSDWGDVHQHPGVIPRSEIALALSSARYLWQRIDWGLVLQWVFWPLALGALVPINTWDWPAYAGFSGLVVLFVATGFSSAPVPGGRCGPGGPVLRPTPSAMVLRQRRSGVTARLAAGLLAAVALAGASLLLYAPFMRYYTPIFVGLGWSLGRTYTDLGEFLTVWGFFLFVSVTLLLILLVRQRSRWACMRLLRLALRYPLRLNRVEELYVLVSNRAKRAGEQTGRRIGFLGGLLLLAVLIWWAWKGYWVLVLMVPLTLLAAALMLQSGRPASARPVSARLAMPDERRYVLALVFASFLILVGIEFFYLKDHLDGDQMGWWRMNTLFKFYLQAWVMLGIAAGVSLPGLWRAAEGWRKRGRWLWSFALTLLLVAAALYPLLGTPARVADRFPGERPPIGSLDGMEFMTVGTYTWPDENNPIPLWGDYQAIRWLQDNVRGTPVLAEAPIGYYREFGVRVSSFTGLPTLVGMHASEQRWGWQVGPRSGQARNLYRTVSLQETMDLIRELDVEYVYVGPLERTEYPQADVKFERLSELGHLYPVYRNDLVTIYRVTVK